MAGALISDLEQGQQFTSKGMGGLVPPMVTHGMLYSWRAERHFVPKEHLVAQGVPVDSDLAAACGSIGGICPALPLLSGREIKVLIGNAMNLVSLGLQIFYICSHLQKPVLNLSRSALFTSDSPTIAEESDFEFELDDGSREPWL